MFCYLSEWVKCREYFPYKGLIKYTKKKSLMSEKNNSFSTFEKVTNRKQSGVTCISWKESPLYQFVH